MGHNRQKGQKTKNKIFDNKMMSYESGYESPNEMFNLVPVEYVEEYPEYTTMAHAEQSIKTERSSPYPTKQSARRRPGKAPARRDSELEPEELQRVQRRRERNRVAASRCRDRRLNRVNQLESEVSKLQASKEELASENESLKKQIEALQFQIESQNSQGEGKSQGKLSLQANFHAETNTTEYPAVKQLEQLSFDGPLKSALLFTPGGRLSLTPLNLNTTVFEFPVITGQQNQNTGSFSQALQA